jgi:hypothetical protein
MPRTIAPEIEEPKECNGTCPRKYPCGGCVPNPPHDCIYELKNRCGAPCQDIMICHKMCHDLHCKSYQEARKLIHEQHKEDVKIWNMSHRSEAIEETKTPQTNDDDWEETVSATQLRRTLAPPEEETFTKSKRTLMPIEE